MDSERFEELPNADVEVLQQAKNEENNETVGDLDSTGQYDGQLPEFSDEESSKPSNPSSSRLPPPRAKGVPGRKKVPPPSATGNLAKLKKKLTPASNKLEVAKKDKQKEKEVVGGEAGVASALASDDAIDKVLAQIALERPEVGGSIQRVDVDTLMKSMGINQDYLQGKTGLMGKGTKDMASHKFWSTQPVLKLGTPEEEILEGPLEENKPLAELRQEPIDLHTDFRWATMDLSEPAELKEVYELLSNNYVEDNEASFRFEYTADFFEWALKPPGYHPDWHVGIRVATTGKLIGFIAGIPLELRVRAVKRPFTEINFICVHKKLRSKRLAPLLIQEITRRTRLRGIFQAIYTAGVFLPTPITRCQYYHRSLNPKKLVDCGFSAIPRNSTMARMIRAFKLPEATTLPGLRELQKKDLKQVSGLLRAFLARMDLAPVLRNKDIEWALWGGRGKDVGGKRVGQVVWCYVVEDPSTQRITDFFSFYSLASTAVKMKPHTLVNAAYLFYYATTACPSCANLGDGSVVTPVTNWQDETAEERKVLKDRLKILITDAMILASKAGFDVFNALTLQDNSLFLEDLKFGRGDGYLHYYLYNYSTKPLLGGIDTSDGGSGVGVVML